MPAKTHNWGDVVSKENFLDMLQYRNGPPRKDRPFFHLIDGELRE